jgi:hypothetical protein
MGKPAAEKVFSKPFARRLFPGNKTPDPQAGLLQNHYGWQWGDALFLASRPGSFGGGGMYIFGTPSR